MAKQLSLEVLAKQKRVIDEVSLRFDHAGRMLRDPVRYVHAGNAEERELRGLIASSLAFGQVAVLMANVARVLDRLGDAMVEVLDDRREAMRRLQSTGHRMVRGGDIARLLVGARQVQKRHGGLGKRFGQLLRDRDEDLRQALGDWVEEIRAAGRLDRSDGGTGSQIILSDPRKSSGCKRLMLYLRWMVRRDEHQVDLGLWDMVPARVLLVPVDTHILRLGRNLGWTQQRVPSWRAAEEITSVLRRFDPDDPVRFDFMLCHTGMSMGCREGYYEPSCGRCGVASVCRHASGLRAGA